MYNEKATEEEELTLWEYIEELDVLEETLEDNVFGL